MATMREGLSYDDVLLVPQEGILMKRKDADLKTRLYASPDLGMSDVWIDVPIVSAPMPSVTEGKMAKAMIDLGGQAVIHRFGTLSHPADQITQWQASGKEAIVALGLKYGLEHYCMLRDAGVSRFCLDVAHGHHRQVEALLKDIHRSRFARGHAWIMAGNVGTLDGAVFLQNLGVEAVKVGIGPGAACRTREVTGFGVPQFTAIMDISQWVNIPIIADGGIKNSGDIVKALAAGANAVMLGSLLAGADEAPNPGEYFGNASHRVNGHRAPEGVQGSVPLTGPVENIIKELAWGIRSGISYAGAVDIHGLQENAEFIRVAPGVSQESSVRIS